MFLLLAEKMRNPYDSGIFCDLQCDILYFQKTNEEIPIKICLNADEWMRMSMCVFVCHCSRARARPCVCVCFCLSVYPKPYGKTTCLILMKLSKKQSLLCLGMCV